jgi:hypothetical protein
VGNISSYNWVVLFEGEGATLCEDEGDEAGGDGGGGEGMLSRLRLGILKKLGSFLLSEDSKTALIAMDLAKAIMATDNGKKTMAEWQRGGEKPEEEWVRQILATVASSTINSTPSFRHNVRSTIMIPRQPQVLTSFHSLRSRPLLCARFAIS